MTEQAAAPSPEDLVAQARPLAGPDPLKVPVEDIPLPPAELADALDNTKAGAANKEAEPPREVATLSFVGDAPQKEFPLRFPFRWEERVVDTVTVRALSTAEMGEAMRAIGASGTYDLYEIYARMAGLPAPVLRAMPAVDGEPITGACFDFLPPSLQPEVG